jgi:hypothetical protein
MSAIDTANWQRLVVKQPEAVRFSEKFYGAALARKPMDHSGAPENMRSVR